jgi:uncharacterized protein YuzE
MKKAKKIINPVRNSKIQRKYYFVEPKARSSKISNGVNYDQKSDALYIGLKRGVEEEFVEISPGINVELDENGQVLGVEILNASRILKSVVRPLQKQILESEVK